MSNLFALKLCGRKVRNSWLAEFQVSEEVRGELKGEFGNG